MTTEPTSIDPPEPADDQRDWFRGHLEGLVDTPVPDGWATIADRGRNATWTLTWTPRPSPPAAGAG